MFWAICEHVLFVSLSDLLRCVLVSVLFYYVCFCDPIYFTMTIKTTMKL
jgi:hypothetical protein